MKKINHFFTIGTVGIIATAFLHILTALFFGGVTLRIAFLILYPIFILFLAIGFKKILKEKNMV